jgi:hypothetical protein
MPRLFRIGVVIAFTLEAGRPRRGRWERTIAAALYHVSTINSSTQIGRTITQTSHAHLQHVKPSANRANHIHTDPLSHAPTAATTRPATTLLHTTGRASHQPIQLSPPRYTLCETFGTRHTGSWQLHILSAWGGSSEVCLELITGKEAEGAQEDRSKT